MLKADVDNDSAYSGEGSNTDSGRGPSEEGDKSIHTSSEFTNMVPSYVSECYLIGWYQSRKQPEFYTENCNLILIPNHQICGLLQHSIIWGTK